VLIAVHGEALGKMQQVVVMTISGVRIDASDGLFNLG
jgi:hypothetical protein